MKSPPPLLQYSYVTDAILLSFLWGWGLYVDSQSWDIHLQYTVSSWQEMTVILKNTRISCIQWALKCYIAHRNSAVFQIDIDQLGEALTPALNRVLYEHSRIYVLYVCTYCIIFIYVGTYCFDPIGGLE
jgi:hypothetical protein